MCTNVKLPRGYDKFQINLPIDFEFWMISITINIDSMKFRASETKIIENRIDIMLWMTKIEKIRITDEDIQRECSAQRKMFY